MRTGEVFALTWDDIDLDNRIIKVNKTVYAKDKKREDEELAYIENLKKAGERNKQRREQRESTTKEKKD